MAQSTAFNRGAGRSRARPRARAPQTRKMLAIQQSEVLSMDPATLRAAVQMAGATAVLRLDDRPGADPAEDDAPYDDMDGEELEDEIDAASSVGTDGPDDQPFGYLQEPLGIDGRQPDSPFLDLGSMYPLLVHPASGSASPPTCHFEPPHWFQGSPSTGVVTDTLNVLATLLAKEFAAFLADPSPATLGACEWRFFAETGNRFLPTRTVLLRRGLEARLQGHAGAGSTRVRLHPGGMGRLLPHTWLLWSRPSGAGGAHPGPVAMPLSTLYAPDFQMAAAAALCRGDGAEWQVDDVEPNVAIQEKRPFKDLGQKARLHLVAERLSTRPDDLLNAIRAAGEVRGRSGAGSGA